MKSLNVFVFVDALGWELASRHEFMTGHLSHRSPCETVFGYSCTCDPTILTGKMPNEHGHFSFFVKAGEGESPFASLGRWGALPELVAGHHRIRGPVSARLKKRLGYTGYFELYSVPFSALPYLDYTEKRDLYEPGGILGGQETIFEVWERSGKPWMRSNWRRGDRENIDELGEAIDVGEIELAYLFTAGTDGLMHRVGTKGPEVEQALRDLESSLLDLMERSSKHYGDVKLHVFSDHGMTDTVSTSTMMRRFESLGLSYGKDYVAVWDSTMGRFWFEDHVRDRALEWLAAQSEGRLLEDDQLEKWGCLFPDRRYGEHFYLLSPGTIFAPSYMNQRRVTGMHGFDPAHPDSTACFLSNNPEANPKALREIFGVMAAAAGVDQKSGALANSNKKLATAG